MTKELDRKETYLYGTLLALVQEQLDALNQKVAGRLGFWGRSRMSGRGRTIAKFLGKIVTHKQSKGDADFMESIATDLKLIDQDNVAWGDISPDQLDYVRNFLVLLAGNGLV